MAAIVSRTLMLIVSYCCGRPCAPATRTAATEERPLENNSGSQPRQGEGCELRAGDLALRRPAASQIIGPHTRRELIRGQARRRIIRRRRIEKPCRQCILRGTPTRANVEQLLGSDDACGRQLELVGSDVPAGDEREHLGRFGVQVGEYTAE